MSFSLAKLKSFGLAALAAGKQNAPSLMTAGSIICGWGAVYLFWKQSRKAEKKIENEEERLNADLDSDTPLSDLRRLSNKDKFIIYLEYCWTSLILGVGSTALAIGSTKLSMDRLAKMMLVTQFMSNREEDSQKLIKKLKNEIPDKKVVELENEVYRESKDDEEIVKKMREMMESGDNRTLFIDRCTKRDFPENIMTVTNGIARSNEIMLKRRSDNVKQEISMTLDEYRKDASDPFFVKSDSPWGSSNGETVSVDELQNLAEQTNEVSSTLDVSDFLYLIGETSKTSTSRLGELMEFRCFSNELPIKQSDILKYDDYYKKTYFAEDENPPEVCVIDYADYIYPTYEFAERDMM